MATHYYKQTRYKLLRTFCVVAQKENITHAAEQLHISQPTVSLQVQALERETGQVLRDKDPADAGLARAAERMLAGAVGASSARRVISAALAG